MAGEAWRQKTGGKTPMEASPYQFTLLQITPPVRLEVYNMGPTPAPVCSQAGLLLESQNLVQGASHMPCSILDEDPFVATSLTGGLPMSQQIQHRPPKPLQAPARVAIL